MKYAIGFVVLAAAATAAAAPAPRPVLIGTDGAGADACTGVGRVVGLNRRGDNYLSVRAAPGTAAQERDRLRFGQNLHVCDRNSDGRWLGVVYTRDPRQNCNLAAPVASPRPYPGPCRSGWVSARYVADTAGGG